MAYAVDTYLIKNVGVKIRLLNIYGVDGICNIFEVL